MIRYIYKGIQYSLHYRAEKIFGQDIWMVSVTIQDQVFTRASTDKELFMCVFGLTSFESIQIGLDKAFFESFKPEIINYLDQ
jgi:hypothetical protein